MKEILSTLSKVLNVAESELSSALMDGDKVKDGAGKFIEDKFASKVSAITEEQKQKYEEAKKNLEGKTKKETAELFEKHLREKYGLSSDKIGEDLLKELDAKVETFKTAKTDPEKVRASETYLQDMNELKKQIDAAKEEAAKPFKTELETLKDSIQKEKVQGAVVKKVDEEIAKLALRDDLPKETMDAIISTVKQAVISGGSYKILENGDLIVVDENGHIKKDMHGNPVVVNDIISNHIKVIPTKAASDKGSAGGGEGGKGGGVEYKGALPKDSNEMVKMLAEIGQEVRAGKKTLDEMKSAEAAMVAHLSEQK